MPKPVPGNIRRHLTVPLESNLVIDIFAEGPAPKGAAKKVFPDWSVTTSVVGSGEFKKKGSACVLSQSSWLSGDFYHQNRVRSGRTAGLRALCSHSFQD